MTILALALVGLAALATTAAASRTPAAGTFVEGPETILDERQAGGNTHIHLTREAVISGAYSGVGQADQWIVIHADGSFNFHQIISFTGVVCGEPVALEFSVVGGGDFGENVLAARYTVIGSPHVGRGNGRIVGEPGVGGTYEGDVHCD
jgi:hypothetical protein